MGVVGVAVPAGYPDKQDSLECFDILNVFFFSFIPISSLINQCIHYILISTVKVTMEKVHILSILLWSKSECKPSSCFHI